MKLKELTKNIFLLIIALSLVIAGSEIVLRLLDYNYTPVKIKVTKG